MRRMRTTATRTTQLTRKRTSYINQKKKKSNHSHQRPMYNENDKYNAIMTKNN